MRIHSKQAGSTPFPDASLPRRAPQRQPAISPLPRVSARGKRAAGALATPQAQADQYGKQTHNPARRGTTRARRAFGAGAFATSKATSKGLNHSARDRTRRHACLRAFEHELLLPHALAGALVLRRHPAKAGPVAPKLAKGLLFAKPSSVTFFLRCTNSWHEPP